jgi:hypothetical protein
MLDGDELDLRVERLEHYLDAAYKELTKRDEELAQKLAALTEVVGVLQREPTKKDC